MCFVSVFQISIFILQLLIFPYTFLPLSLKILEVQETWVQFLGWRLKEMAIQSSILAWRTPWAEEPDGLQSLATEQHQQHDSESRV